MTARALYGKLLRLYPRRFRELLGESMEQTFQDLYNERRQQSGRGFFLLAIFTETILGIVHEYLLLLIERNVMKKLLTNPAPAAITSFVLALPIGLLRLILASDREPLIAPIASVLTVDGSQPNVLGYTFICGGLLLLPVALAVNLRPLLKREGPDRKRKLYALNLSVGAILSLLILFTWGGLILEQIYCLRGIRCD